jgi:D-galactarolactone isomerase
MILDRPPSLKAPDGATDCHMHVYDERYTPVATAPFKPPQAPIAAYLAVQAQLGLERVVVVQPAAYGFDNSCTLEAMAAFGPGARGIAVVPPGLSADELARLDRAGVRGVRYFMLAGGLLPWDSLEAMAARIAPLGWHINLQLDGRDLPLHMPMLRRLPVDLVIDHNGKFLEPVGSEHAAFGCLLELLDAGRTWIKLAAPYETSKVGPPHYEDVSALARSYVRTHPERCLWASNWPHPNRTPQPSSAAMLDMLLYWADDEVTRRRILVDNPAVVYRY